MMSLRILLSTLHILNNPRQHRDQFLFDLLQADGIRPDMLFRHGHDIRINGQGLLVQPEKLLEQAFDSIPFDRFADFLAHGRPKARPVSRLVMRPDKQ